MIKGIDFTSQKFPCFDSGDRVEKGERGISDFTVEQPWEDNCHFPASTVRSGSALPWAGGEGVSVGPCPLRAQQGDLPTQRMLKQKPCDVDLLTSWSGRLSKPTWPDRDRFLRSSFCKTQKKSIQQGCNTPSGKKSCQNGVKDTEAFGTQDLCLGFLSQTHSPFPSIHLCLWGSGAKTSPTPRQANTTTLVLHACHQ